MKNLYLQEKHPWGTTPNNIVKNFLPAFKKGTVLDLGSGDGRDVKFLTESGFKVIAVDKYIEALEDLVR